MQHSSLTVIYIRTQQHKKQIITLDYAGRVLHEPASQGQHQTLNSREEQDAGALLICSGTPSGK